jgi:DinB superfamily
MHRILCHVVFTWALAAPSTVLADPMTAGERQRVLAHFEMTEAWLASETSGLSTAQLTFRMTPDSWSVQDVVEHLAIAEPQYWQQLQDSLQQPVGYKSESTDAAILWYGIDRTNRQKTGEARVPKGKYENIGQSLADFRKLRGTMAEFVKSTQEDLRGRQLKGGNMDLYQWLLMISTHSQRHILQIREVKAHASYPRK